MIDLVKPDPGLYFWTIGTFLVLFLLLRQFAWRPLLQALQEREQSIRQSVEDAARARTELERVQQEAREILAEARVEGQGIVNSSRSRAEKLREDLLAEARAKADSVVERARTQIEGERDRAVAQIRAEVVNLSVMVASKLIRRNITAQDNRALIEESLDQIDSSM